MAEDMPEGDWIECWDCSGQGQIENCFEDTCCWNDCDVCNGKGGWFYDIYEPPTGADARPAGEDPERHNSK